MKMCRIITIILILVVFGTFVFLKATENTRANHEESVEDSTQESIEESTEESSLESTEESIEESSQDSNLESSEEASGEVSIEASDEVSLPLYGDPLVTLEGWSVGFLTYDLLTGELLTGGNMDKNFLISMPSCSGLPVQASPKDLLGFYLANPEMFHCSSGTSSFTEKAFKGDIGTFKAISGKGDRHFSEMAVLMDESTDSPSTLVICLAEADHTMEEKEILQTIVDVYFTILGGPYPEF